MYETSAGRPTRGLMFQKLIDSLREAQDSAAMLAHLQKTEDGFRDVLIAKGWLAISEMLRKMQHQVTLLGQGRLQ